MTLIKFENLPSTKTPINAENLNNNFSELNLRGLYSTNETIIGTTDKGENIYRKKISFSSLTNSFDNNIGFIENVKEIQNMYGIAHEGGDNFTLPHSDYRNIEWNIGLNFNSGNILIQKGGYGTVNNGHVIVEYTKTTN